MAPRRWGSCAPVPTGRLPSSPWRRLNGCWPTWPPASPKPWWSVSSAAPGQKEERWAHLFCGPDLEVAGRFAEGAVPAGSPSASLGSGARNELQARVEVLEAQLQQLQSQFGVLCAQLGVDVELALVSVEAAEPTWPEANRGSS